MEKIEKKKEENRKKRKENFLQIHTFFERCLKFSYTTDLPYDTLDPSEKISTRFLQYSTSKVAENTKFYGILFLILLKNTHFLKKEIF